MPDWHRLPSQQFQNKPERPQSASHPGRLKATAFAFNQASPRFLSGHEGKENLNGLEVQGAAGGGHSGMSIEPAEVANDSVVCGRQCAPGG
ncbi:MAG: hypothetical protein EBZ13_04465 [Planctomycetia bacterium]|nr:hypothetical protein [Planctomycetia bacterium]